MPHALFGPCPVWPMPCLAHALFGLFALFGPCPVWPMPCLAHALFGPCPIKTYLSANLTITKPLPS